MIKIHDQVVPARGVLRICGRECDQEGVGRNEPRCDMVTPRG